MTPGGARFFDCDSRDRGWARKVTRRVPGLSSLTVLDVVAPEPALAQFLTTLDKNPLTVQVTEISGESYEFVWASGYNNGADVRIQGVLDERGRLLASASVQEDS
jgi:hypothetical protein